MDLLMLLPSLSFPFDTVKMLPEGLLLSKCSCAGTARYFIPRAHVDYVTTGRELWIKTLLAGVALLIIGIIFMTQGSDSEGQDGQKKLGEILLYAGIGVAAFALLSMLPTTLSVSSNHAVFTSTKCCNNADAIIAWLRSGTGHELVASAAVVPLPVVVPMAQVQQQGGLAHRADKEQQAKQQAQQLHQHQGQQQMQQQQQQQQHIQIQQQQQMQEQQMRDQQMQQQQQMQIQMQQQQQQQQMQQQQQIMMQQQQAQQQVQMYPHPPMVAADSMPSYAQAQSQYSTLQYQQPRLSSRRAARPVTPRIDSPSHARPELLELAVPGEVSMPSAPLHVDAGASASYDAVSDADVHIVMSPHQVP